MPRHPDYSAARSGICDVHSGDDRLVVTFSDGTAACQECWQAYRIEELEDALRKIELHATELMGVPDRHKLVGIAQEVRRALD